MNIHESHIEEIKWVFSFEYKNEYSFYLNNNMSKVFTLTQF